MSEGTRRQDEKAADAGAPAPIRAYEPPRVEKLGSLRDLLAVKTGPAMDPSPIHPGPKR